MSASVPSAAPLEVAPQSPALVQQQDGGWVTTIEVDTAALCQGTVSFDLVTTSPAADTPDPKPGYRCAAGPLAKVTLAFSLPAGEIPQSATLVITPPRAVLAQNVSPLDITLTVGRHVSAFDYLWLPVICGAALAALLVIVTMIVGVPRMDGTSAHTHRQHFWGMPLYASSAWTFGDSWATNITAIGALIGAVLTASGAVSTLLPGVEVGRFGLLIVVAGGITVVAPLLFGALNSRFTNVDPTTEVATISLPAGKPEARITVKVPASASIAVPGGQGASVPAGGVIEIGPAASAVITARKKRTRITRRLRLSATARARARATERARPRAARTQSARPVTTIPAPGPDNSNRRGGYVPVLALPGTNDIAIAPGQLITATGGQPLIAPEGATISFLGRASITLPTGARIDAPSAEPGTASRGQALRYEREFAIPHSGEMVAAKMWSMLAAAALTMFGIGAELGIVGIVLGFNLAVAPLWARSCGLAVAIAGALLVLGYGVSAIRALADSRENSALSGARGSSFTL